MRTRAPKGCPPAPSYLGSVALRLPRAFEPVGCDADFGCIGSQRAGGGDLVEGAFTGRVHQVATRQGVGRLIQQAANAGLPRGIDRRGKPRARLLPMQPTSAAQPTGSNARGRHKATDPLHRGERVPGQPFGARIRVPSPLR